MKMAARLRSIIRRHVGARLSAARPSMGARFCSISSSSIPSSQDQALHPRRVKSVLDYVHPVAVAGVIFSFGLWIDVMGWRSSHANRRVKVEREKRKYMLAEVAMMERDIDTIKMRHSGRAPKNERTTGWSAFKFW